MTTCRVRITLSDKRTGLCDATLPGAAHGPPPSWGVLPIDVEEVLP